MTWSAVKPIGSTPTDSRNIRFRKASYADALDASDIASGQVWIDSCYFSSDSQRSIDLYALSGTTYSNAAGVLGQASILWAGRCSIDALVLNLNITFPEQYDYLTSGLPAPENVGPHEVYASGQSARVHLDDRAAGHGREVFR